MIFKSYAFFFERLMALFTADHLVLRKTLSRKKTARRHTKNILLLFIFLFARMISICE